MSSNADELQGVDLFWSFRSPYSYLAVPGAQRLETDFRVRVVFRPVLPLAVREPGFFSPDNLKRARYIALDWLRRAEMLGMPHAWPKPDPIVQDLTTYQIAAEQPHIHRLTRLGVEAQRRGRGLAFAREVSALIFGGTRGWNEGTHLADATARAGLDLKSMEAAIADPASHQAEIEASQAALAASGHWGVPTFVFKGEPFFGEDRIDTLRWRLARAGLAREGVATGAEDHV
ncbi:MAG: DsbA family protein [Burkholderiales bacterium]|nr:DsbA family protein [Burkholderiales bacterium]